MLCMAGCKPRAFWECTNPEPVIRMLEPPQAWLLHEGTPGMFDGACSAAYDRSYGSLASEVEITMAVADRAERLGFERVPAVADSSFWCAREKRFHQFARGDLVLRMVVEPLPFTYGEGRVLERGEGRFGVFVALRNYDRERVFACTKGHSTM